ncbi:MAG: ribonuclease HII, partial [Bacteroidia bacterium]|nr:ribonuclease HII [Bacteroidia bacterium]
VLGNVEQIDIYKNGRLQLAFATPKRVYVLDRNGKEVNPFPIKFNDEITQPLSVFDYDKKKNYRFFVVQNKETLMMDVRGKTVKGFTFKKANSNIITQPKHFRIGTKDYIVFASGKKLNILDRTGKTRIQVKRDFSFSDNEIYLYKGYFSFTNIKGQLVQVDQKGRVNYKNLLLPRDHDLTTTSKTLVALADNRLKIKSNDIELDFGNYTEPKIYYLKDKIYVAVTELQSQKAYLFDTQTQIIPNFPVYGNSTLELDNLDKDRELEFVVKGEANSLVLYQIN